VSTIALDVEAVRRRFSALRPELVFFDGPGGTQTPDEVIDAIASYLRHDNANSGGPFATSARTDALLERARVTAGSFLGCGPEEVVFGANMTTLNFALSRTVGRKLAPGDEIVVTRLDHDGNIAPWLELADDLGLVVRFADVHDETTLDLDDLESKLTDRTRVLAFPVASNAVGTLTDVSQIVKLAHGVGAIAWADAVHYGPHGPIDVRGWGVDVLICSPYKFFGPHLGLAYVGKQVALGWRPYKVRPADDQPLGSRFQTGTQPHELFAGFIAAVEYIESIGWEAIQAYERTLGQRFLAGLPHQCRLYGLDRMDGRVPTFAFNVDGLSPEAVATHLGERGFAVWHGDYYAIEIMRRLELPAGAVRVGLLHYNTFDEVDRLLDELGQLA